MNEFDLIKLLTAQLPRNDQVVVGPGDDCAVLRPGAPDEDLLYKTDAVVEGVHFTPETPAEQVGHKALARPLSDIAAMAGKPIAALVTLGLPEGFDPARVEKIYDGMNRLAARHDVAIVGGETTRNPGGIFISVALLGTVKRGCCPLRSGARVGDAVFVSGELGGSIAEHHLTFEPRLREAQWLARTFQIHSMIDLSDGLAGDFQHVLTASGVGAEIFSRAIPIRRAARTAHRADSSAKPPLLAALTDGEDFELLFTIDRAQAVPVLDGWKSQFPETRLSCIGRITQEAGLRLQDERGVRTLNAHGYRHFP